jgi:hypothetical protein
MKIYKFDFNQISDKHDNHFTIYVSQLSAIDIFASMGINDLAEINEALENQDSEESDYLNAKVIGTGEPMKKRLLINCEDCNGHGHAEHFTGSRAIVGGGNNVYGEEIFETMDCSTCGGLGKIEIEL